MQIVQEMYDLYSEKYDKWFALKVKRIFLDHADENALEKP